MFNHVGQKFGNYTLVRLLGRGGFASVYLGEHTYLKTYAAIKVLQTQLATDALEAFLQEGRTIAALRHPNIVRVLEFGVEGNTPFLVMDYAPKGSLAQVYPRGIAQPIARILPHIQQVARALQYAHDQHMIHRDVKPDNMLLGQNEEVLLSDFGIAMIAHSTRNQPKQDVAGTGPYMAPEQIRGLASPKSDQYALGIVVYEWLSGHPPFQGTFLELISQHLHAAAPPLYKELPTLPTDVEEIVMIALRKEPERRFTHISVFADALTQASLSTRKLLPLPTSTPAPSAQQPPPNVAISATQLPLSPVQQLQSASTIPMAQALTLPAQQSQALPLTPGVQALSPSVLQAQWKQSAPISRRRMLLGLIGLGGASVVVGATLWFTKTRTQGKGMLHSAPVSTPRPTVPPQIVIGGLLSTYTGHTDRVFAVAWSPDGKWIASGSWDKTVHVWDAHTGQTISIYRGHTDAVNALAWSPDSTRIVSSSVDGTAQVWVAANARSLFTYNGHAGSILQYGVSAVAWSHNGNYIVSAGDDRTVQIWNAANKTPLYTYTGHTNIVRTVAWSFDDSHIASGGFDKKVRVWNALTGSHLMIYAGHHAPLCSLAWSPSRSGGQYIVSASDDGQVHIWDVNTQADLTMRSNAKKYTLPPDPLGRPAPDREEDDFYAPGTNVFAVAWSADGKRIASVNVGGYVLTWDALTQANIFAYSSSTLFVNAVAWSPDGGKLVSGNDGDLVQIWQER